MKNKLALITGSTSGIGLGIAHSFASNGCNIIINGFGKEEDIQKLLEIFRKSYDVKADYIFADLSKPGDIEKMLASIKEKYPGGVDIVVNNAGWGRIVNISSAMGLVGREFGAPYCSAKHGVIGLTKVIALETAGTGVTCNAVCPGYVDTPAVRGVVEKSSEKYGSEEKAWKYLLQEQPTGVPIPIDQVASMVTYLCSDSASQITGSALPVDGGYTTK